MPDDQIYLLLYRITHISVCFGSQSLRRRSYKEKQEKTAILVAKIKKNILKNERQDFHLRYMYRAGLSISIILAISIAVYKCFIQ